MHTFGCMLIYEVNLTSSVEMTGRKVFSYIFCNPIKRKLVTTVFFTSSNTD